MHITIIQENNTLHNPRKISPLEIGKGMRDKSSYLSTSDHAPDSEFKEFILFGNMSNDLSVD